MSFFKRIVIFCIIFVFTLGFSSVSYANEESDSFKILKQSDTVRITETRDQNNVYQATFNKKEETIQLKVINKETKEIISNNLLDLSDTAKEYREKIENFHQNTETYSAAAASSIYQNTFSNFEYTIYFGSPNQWILRRSGKSPLHYYYFKTEQTSVNGSYLTRYQDLVEQINIQELKVIGATAGTTAAYVFATLFSAGIATGAIATYQAVQAVAGAIGVQASQVYLVVELNSLCRKAYTTFHDALNKSNVWY